MRHFFSSFLFFFSLYFTLNSAPIETFYGTIDVEEPIIIELIESPAFQRLRLLRQYGVDYYVSNRENFTRYDHSLGVFAILRLKGASLEEQIAGLLHDVSHTAFSHVGDWIFDKAHQEDDYQNHIHTWFLKESGVEAILHRYGYSAQQVDPKQEAYRMLEQPLPNLCADRIDYNIQGAFYQDFISREEGIYFLNDLEFVDGEWVSTRPDIAAKLMHFSLYMSVNFWGSAQNDTTSHWLAQALHRGVEIGLLSWRDVHFGTDEEIWNRLNESTDCLIANRLKYISNPHNYFCLVEPEKADYLIRFKNRGIDPWIIYQGRRVRLTSLDPLLAKEFNEVVELSLTGWPVKLLTPPDSIAGGTDAE